MWSFDRRVWAASPSNASHCASFSPLGYPRPTPRALPALAVALLALGCASDPTDPSDPTLALSVTSHDFGALAIGARSPVLAITVSNSGTAHSGTLAVGLSGPSSGDFQVLKDECSGVRLSRGATCAVEVEVIPTVP